MPYYYKLGEIPPKKHVTFFKSDGKSLYREELFSTRGFSGAYATKYHLYMPTRVEAIAPYPLEDAPIWEDAPLQYYHFLTHDLEGGGNYFSARSLFLKNSHCQIATARVTAETDIFFRNAYWYEYIFVHFGEGVLDSEYGRIPFGPGDQLIIPKGSTYRISFKDYAMNRLLIVESDTPFDFPKHYRNAQGQLLEHAPLSERDIRPPQYMPPCDESGPFQLVLKAARGAFVYTLDHHPFDVVGWDGYLYPYAFNIRDYMPKVGKIHLPPPVHMLFQTGHFVLCNFVPRLFDFHRDAIPAPYFHFNNESEEVLYYVAGDFMSRKGVRSGSITVHPSGIPHGPQPGKTEASVGVKSTDEYAIMVDTFEPLLYTTHVRSTLDANYYRSWLPTDGGQ